MNIHHLEAVAALQELKNDILDETDKVQRGRELLEQSEYAKLHQQAVIDCRKKEEEVLDELVDAIDAALMKLGVTFS